MPEEDLHLSDHVCLQAHDRGRLARPAHDFGQAPSSVDDFAVALARSVVSLAPNLGRKYVGRDMDFSNRILTFPEYAALRHGTPYIVDVANADTRLMLFGSWHSSDPSHPMFDQIESAFLRLSPAFALHEGTPPSFEPEREIAIRRHGEAGLVLHLAARLGIATASMDIPLEDEARQLCESLSLGEALVFLVVRQLASFNRKTARMDFDGYFRDFFERIAGPLGLPSIEWPLIECEHRRVLSYPLAPRSITGTHTDPMRSELLTQRIARLSNRRRDEYMLRQLIAAIGTHRRVFATVGVTHAVMLEPALRAAIAEPFENRG